ncbi:MAG: hypothetical protein O2U62_00020 [Candidatus Bathyarchaeota archaeon]|nr:hypothetical protein [Candidatus Bathyarchaeota archaeon]
MFSVEIVNVSFNFSRRIIDKKTRYAASVREDTGGFKKNTRNITYDMTEKDRSLIARARRLPPSYWGDIDSLIEQADTDEAKEALMTIQKALHHAEECTCGLQ